MSTVHVSASGLRNAALQLHEHAQAIATDSAPDITTGTDHSTSQATSKVVADVFTRISEINAILASRIHTTAATLDNAANRYIDGDTASAAALAE